MKLKNHAVFVDGENFSIRIGEILKLVCDDFILPKVKDNFCREMFWHIKYSGYFNKIKNSELIRIYYYGSMKMGGSGNEIEIQRRELQNIGIGETFAVQKKGAKQSKTIDIKLSTDLLSLAASGRVDEIFLVSMDADYIPVIEKAKGFGVKMTLAFPGFDLIKLKALTDIDNLKEKMGVSKSSNYILSFDRIDNDIEWFSIKPILPDEFESISEITNKILNKFIPDKTWKVDSYGKILSFTQEQNEKIRIFFKTNRKVDFVFINNYGSTTHSLNYYPKSDFEHRLSIFVNDIIKLLT